MPIFVLPIRNKNLIINNMINETKQAQANELRQNNCLRTLEDYVNNLPDHLQNNGITTDIVSIALKDKQNLINKANYYVTMNDKFMGGWGLANNKTNKLIIACETYQQAQIIKNNAEKRKEMKYINICSNKPQIKASVYPSWKHFEDMCEIWTKK